MDFTLGFVAGSFLAPLVLFAIASIIIICSLEYENGWFPTLVVGGAFLAFHYLLGVPVFSYIWENIGLLALYVLGYGIIGGVYSVFKWYRYSLITRERIKEVEKEFLVSKGIPGDVMSDELKLEWAEYFKSHNGYAFGGKSIENAIPQWHTHKALLLQWVTYWPWSLVWTVINDPIRRFVRFIVRQLQQVYQHITDVVYADVRKNILTPERRIQLEQNARERQAVEHEEKMRQKREEWQGGLHGKY